MRHLRLVLAAATMMAVVPAIAQAQTASGTFKWGGTGVAPTGSYAWWWRDGGGNGHNVMGGGAYRASFSRNGCAVGLG